MIIFDQANPRFGLALGAASESVPETWLTLFPRIWGKVAMPWKESSVMDERLRFVARLLESEPMSDVCRELGTSRTTGYKIFERYKEDDPLCQPAA